MDTHVQLAPTTRRHKRSYPYQSTQFKSGQPVDVPQLERWLGPEFRAATPQAVVAIRARLRANDPTDFLCAYRIFAGSDPQITGRLGTIDCPALVTTGELDRGSTPAMARAMAHALPGAECVILPGLRHLPTADGAETVNAMLLDFLDRTVTR